MDYELLRDLTESYLKSVIAEAAAGELNPHFDSFTVFGELGINSFQVLKIIKKLEADFGTLPKSLLFENFNVNDLGKYFVKEHEQTLAVRFADALQGAGSYAHDRAPQQQPAEVHVEAPPPALTPEAAPILMLERDAFRHPELKELLQGLYTRHKVEGAVSRGTRKIAPNVFIGSERRGYFNYGRTKDIILVYGYTGPRDHVPVLLEEVYRHCSARGLQLNLLVDEQLPPIGGTPFSATPFGVLQRITGLQEFTLHGGPSRRLRYQVAKFQKSGRCRTEEYRCGSDRQTDAQIAAIIDKWCASKTMVNPLVHDLKAEIAAGTLDSEHRIFLTYLDDVLQNAILITAMSAEENGYLMDLEFYLPDMPLGGLEFGIVQIIETLVREGRDVLSLGGTYGCKLEPSASADPEIDRILDDLRAQNIFNDEGNLQFKNKFRPENKPIFLCRPAGSDNPGNVLDIIMMIADPVKMQTPDQGNHTVDVPRAAMPLVVAPVVAAPPVRRPAPLPPPSAARGERVVSADAGDRARILSDSGFNPLNIAHEHVDFDLKTDSWSQLELPAIHAQMKQLHAQLHQPVNVDDSLRAVFPFAHFVLTSSGQAAEHIFFKARAKKGVVPQNLLFPSTIFHQIDKGFDPRELPHPALFDLKSPEPYKGNLAWEPFAALVAQDPAAIPFVCIEVSDNAAGGNPVSLQHLREVKALLAPHSIPLVLDVTRVVENAQFLVEHEAEHAGQGVWAVVREILSCADAVIGSLTKDFCVDKGGIVATNDAALFARLQELLQEEGAGIDLIDGKLIALSLQNRKQIEAKVLRRMEAVRTIAAALVEHGVPVVQPVGAHCILIDVRQLAEFKDLSDPVASFLSWLYLTAGVRAGAHSVGMQKRTAINDLVRLAIPVGLNREQVESVIERLVQAFSTQTDIPEVFMESSAPQPLGGVYTKYRLLEYHNASQHAVEPAVTHEALPVLAPQVLPVPASEPVAATIPVRASTKPQRTGDIAIIGMAGRYPKAKNLAQLWDNLVQGRDCIEEIPADRYEERLQHGSAAKYRGGFIDDVDRFDSLFFNISPREAEILDPQERLFLEVAWEALEDAGYYPETLASDDASRNVGMFVGAVWAMYQILAVEETNLGNPTVANSFLWSIANRASYALNLSGPSLTVDTACSSSLTALYLACEAIQGGKCSAAIVGGVNLDLHQAKFNINHKGGALSPDGVCRTFGKGANGYVMGEGVGALFIKPLEQAVEDGDNIYGVIKSAVINHGGRTSGYTVPNPKAQADVISAALEEAGIDAETIGYVEAHGTGTELGDPVEITGLSNAFQPAGNQTCAIGSIKSNIGHLEAAAGVVSVSKVLLQMKHRRLVPSLHSAELNGFIDFERSPFYVVQQLEEWKAKEVDGMPLPLRAGISSFGAGGSNAHIILESYEPLRQPNAAPDRVRQLIFPLSARTEDQLREAAVRLGSFVEANGIELNDVAYTLQHGRKSFEHRVAVLAKTKEELLERLGRFTDGKKSEDIAVGQVKGDGVTRLLKRREKQEFIRIVSQDSDRQRIAALWAEGLLADWQGFPSDGSGRTISMPTYPFADKRHWAYERSAVRRSLQSAAGLHPMIDSNESTFERQLFRKSFHERDFFIYDHHVSDIPTLPGAAYLELARKAGEIAAGRKVQRIKNILWVSPIAVQRSIPKDVFVELKPNEATVRFEVFSNDDSGTKVLHSQGSLAYATQQEAAAEPEFIDLDAIRARCVKVTDGETAYPLFKAFGLELGPSFQVLQDVYKNDAETLGVLKLPSFREADLQSMILPPSLLDGSLQAGMAAHLGGQVGEMFVPFSIGEVEILHPLQPNCFSYVTEVKDDRKSSKVVKSNVLIVDEAGKILVRIRESVGVPLRELYEKPAAADGVSRLYYSYDWEKAPLVSETAKQPGPRSLLLFANDEALRDSYRARVGPNEQVILVRPGDGFEDTGDGSYTVSPRSKDDFVRLLAALTEKGSVVENICFAWAAGDQALEESLEKGVYSFLFLCQALIAQKLESTVQLLYLHTSGAGEVQPHNEAMRGFVNTLRLEHPKLLCKAIEVRRDSDVVDAVLAELDARTQDATAILYEGQERSIRKLESFELEDAAPASGAAPRENGVYLITGGAGGLGLIFAEYLAREHKARLVLTGRSALSAEREARLDELRKSGAEVLYLPADVSDREQVRSLIDECKSRFGAIHGVIHAAGVLRDSLIRNKTAEEMSAVLAPKVYGTLHLDELTKDEDLDFFVTFSSLAAVMGNAGQCDYSFANHFMDSFAAGREARRAAGARSGKTLSLDWSIWADGGMKVDAQTQLLFEKAAGIRVLSAATGLDAFVRGLASARTQFVVVEGIQERVELAWGLRKPAPAAAAPAPSPAAAGQAATVSVADGELLARLQRDMTQIVMDLLKLEAADIEQDKILLDLGFDSIGLTTFANAVNEKYALDITPVLFFDYPSIAEIAKYLSSERKGEILQFYGGSAAASQSATPVPQQPAARAQEAGFVTGKGWDPTAHERAATAVPPGGGFSPELRFANTPIAIVGMSGVMPESADLGEFWENLKSSKDMISVIPADRWRWEDYDGDPLKEQNKSSSRWGGFMKEVDKFDPLFFGISPREAHMMDPQQRIFLETVWKAIEDSGQKVSDLSGTRTGLFVGVATNDYVDLLTANEIVLDGYTASGNSHSILANRVSFLLNLHGPSAPIDTACSSSLVALHRAIESIHTGSCEMAIVGGVQVMLSPAAYISFSMAGMLSPDGKCKTFDKRANGYVRGEGCGAIFIKTLAAAERDGNHIYAVIRATAENHGGKVTTMTAPNSVAQAELLVEAYEKARIDPTTVGYIECHGTGTSLGDPIEVQALGKAFAELYRKHNKPPATVPHCGLSTVKTNIGHLETAAGIASLLKALLAIQHKQIPANVHFEELNPYISLKGTPFYIAEKLTPWEAPISEDGRTNPRRAGVSSFGFGGANAHIVLEEYIPPARPSPARALGPQLIVLSAKNEERLRAYAQSLQAYLEKTEAVELVDVAYTLQVGRDEMPERLALVASSAADITRKLAEFLEGTVLPQDVYRGNARQAAAAADESDVRGLVERNELSKLAELWASGAKLDWPSLHGTALPRRISLPTYPFARERHWIPESKAPKKEQRELAAAMPALLHPLVHRNVSTLREQKFTSHFTGSEFFLADHRVGAQAVLPGVAYFEFAMAAARLSGLEQARSIRDLVWMMPIVVGSDAKDVEISLVPGQRDVKFSVRSFDHGHPIVHCEGKLGESTGAAEAEVVDLAGIRERCTETIAGPDLYALLGTSGLTLGKGFQVVQRVHAGPSSCLAVLQLPEHLQEQGERFSLHPSLMDGSVHTAIGLAQRQRPDMPWSVPASVGEVEMLHPLNDLYAGYVTWAVDDSGDIRLNIQLLDGNGKVLVRVRDFIAKPLQLAAPKTTIPIAAAAPQDADAGLQSLVPVWNPIRVAASKRVALPESSQILLIGGDHARLDWVRTTCPGAQLLELEPSASIDVIEQKLAVRPFEQLLWIAPDVHPAHGESWSEERFVEQQEAGVLAVFRIIKALLRSGYGTRKLQWTLVTGRTQRVTESGPVRPAHAGIVGLIGSLAKEYPQWDLRLVDVDSLASVSARDCLTLPWDKQGNALAHRHGEWFQQGLARLGTVPQELPTARPVYRENGVYVVIGGAGGVGEVWTRFMIEHYRANVVWIGRREYDAAIEEKVNSLAGLGPAPLYISADATDLDALERARETILQLYPAIHGVVQSAIVLRDQSLAGMDEAGFRASLSAKVDVSVNMDRVFGEQELDFMLFFSSIISFAKSPGQSNYSAGCTFKDSFALALQQRRAYPVKIMNWGYWGNVGVVADEAYNRIMAQMGIGSIEPDDGMASLQALAGSGLRQLVLVRTLNSRATAGLNLCEAVTYLPRPAPATAPPSPPAVAAHLLPAPVPSAHRVAEVV
ncbi:MAG TPA: SDR family NAD(P)-dependent oxidoreductase [Thermoanaerobaculia bacterium]|nr:SDR family NAD(P)-dependent oxidoreductase [Thermoanaerobaculia bacterium]